MQWDFQRKAAKRALESLRGVDYVTDHTSLSARPVVADTDKLIREALTRNAGLDAAHITVAVSGNTATLTGTVRSWAEKHQAAQAVWSSPHVTQVDNRITVHA